MRTLLPQLRRLCSTPEPLVERVAALKERLAIGLEWAANVRLSAEQWMLEHDPAERKPREHYYLHYQELASSALRDALGQYETLRESVGAATMDEFLQSERLEDKDSSLRVMLADTMLARDKLEAAMRQGRRRQEANEIVCE